MRRKIELYINGSLADIATDALVLMNYKQTDATAPAAVYNSWSQSVVLPRTSKNNAIFDHIFRADHKTTSGKFNALARTPFAIYDEQGDILESGYLKLTDMNETQYNATLYGGLGGFLFGLMYNSDGSKRSLADLVYMSGGDSHEFDFKITRDAVRDAWRRVAGLDGNPSKWDYINFAPCYNGLPGGDFNSKRAFCPVTGIYGVTGNESGYTSRRDHVLVDLANNVDEWAANDLRSYQQRPVVRMKAVIDAICAAANNGGYTVNLDECFFKPSNPYYSKLWLTLPKMDSKSLPVESESGTLTPNDPTMGALPSYAGSHEQGINGPWENGEVKTYDVSCKIVPACLATAIPNYDFAASWYFKTNPGEVTHKYYIVALYQLLAYANDGTLIGGSKVVGATTRRRNYETMTYQNLPYATLEDFINAYNNADNAYGTFAPAWIPSQGSAYENNIVQGDRFSYDWIEGKTKLLDSNGDPVEITLTINDVPGVAAIGLRTSYVCLYDHDDTTTSQLVKDNLPSIADRSVTELIDALSYVDAAVNYTARTGGNVHSGAPINKAFLLGGTHTPADYLLSYLKTFGLYITYDKSTNEVSILTRKSFFNGGDVNLEDRIHLPSRKSIPYAINARWYEWGAPVSGRFANYYRDIYNKDYGQARVNTGFEFDASHNDVLKDCVFRGAAEVLHRNKYFVRVTENSKAVPSPFLDGGKYTLWNSANEAKQYDITCPDNSATINYVNADYPGYDYTLLPKPEFCDKDNKSVGGEDVLLLYDGANGTAYYNRMTLTDDNGLMTLYNEGAPCYLLGQWTIAGNKKYTINYDDGGDSGSFNRSFDKSFDTGYNETKLYMPRFRRILTGSSSPMVATHTVEMAVPAEIDQPAITCAADKAVYPRGWANYITDKMNADTKVVTCKVDLGGFKVGQDLLRNFYFFDGCLWVLNQIKNYVVGGDGLTECEFIKVNDKTKYTNGQTY